MSLQDYQVDLIEKAMSVGPLKFGDFTLESGRYAVTSFSFNGNKSGPIHRTSPYFFNSGLLNTGLILSALARAFVSAIVNAQKSSTNPIPQFDILFGPAYKGIPFSAMTVMHLHDSHAISVGLAYDRKEVKDHGEGSKMVGASVKGRKILILDDVMTTGTTVCAAIDLVKREGGDLIGVVQCLDREEVGKDSVSNAVKEVEEIVGVGCARAILRMRDLMA